jgi:hypothetical protein
LSQNITSVNFKVHCINDGYSIRKMHIRCAVHEGTKIFAPCNGCDFMDGSDVCLRCISEIHTLFTRHYDEIDILKPIYPSYPQR